jgi:Tol biopolymer transport system component
VPGDTKDRHDAFFHDLVTGATTRVSVAGDGTQANAYSSQTAISADGRHVVYTSGASDLVPGDTNGVLDVFVQDTAPSGTRRVSVASDRTQADATHQDEGYGSSISGDGRYVAFWRGRLEPCPGDSNVHDTPTGQKRRVSVASDRKPSRRPAILAFTSPKLARNGASQCSTKRD